MPQIERALQAEILLRLRAGAYPIIAVPVPNGVWLPARTPAERSLRARIIARMKADGMMLPGAPDLFLAWRNGCAFVELKRPATRDLLRRLPAGKPTATQCAFAERAARIGVNYALCHSWDELYGLLEQWGAI